MPHHSSTGSRQNKEERAEQLGEQASPFLSRVVEVADALDDVLLVAGQWAERGDFLCCWHRGHTFLGWGLSGRRVLGRSAEVNARQPRTEQCANAWLPSHHPSRVKTWLWPGGIVEERGKYGGDGPMTTDRTCATWAESK